MHTQFLLWFLYSSFCFEKRFASTCYSEEYYANEAHICRELLLVFLVLTHGSQLKLRYRKYSDKIKIFFLPLGTEDDSQKVILSTDKPEVQGLIRQYGV